MWHDDGGGAAVPGCSQRAELARKWKWQSAAVWALSIEPTADVGRRRWGCGGDGDGFCGGGSRPSRDLKVAAAARTEDSTPPSIIRQQILLPSLVLHCY